MSAICFVDCETTGLDPAADDIWEFAGIRREDDGSQTDLHLFIKHNQVRCSRLPEPFRTDHATRFEESAAVTKRRAATEIAAFMGGKAHIVGAVPNFDTERIATMLYWHRLKPDWHYHLIDVENLAVGFINGRCHEAALWDEVPKNLRDSALVPPWDSDELSRLVGVEPPTDARHTAMGDARWAMAIYDRVMGGPGGVA